MDPTKLEETVTELAKEGVAARLRKKMLLISLIFGNNAQHIFELAKEMALVPGLVSLSQLGYVMA